MRKKLLFMAALGLAFVCLHCKKADNQVNNWGVTDTLVFSKAEKDLIYSGASDTLMYVLNYFIPADSVILRSHSRNVSLTDTTTLFYLIDRMYKTVRDPQHPGVGIAAPQVGILRNIIWVQRYDQGSFSNHPFRVYLNPRITRYSDTTEMMSDGCLSIPGVSANSRRAVWVDIDYMSTDGSYHHEHISHKYTAHIFQHEIDHLNGTLFIDRLQ